MILNLVYDESTQNEEISFSVFHSDYSRNQMVQELMVSTLVKYSSSGRYETYLAKEWEVSSDKKTWTFMLQDNVYTENKTQIDAYNLKKSLIKLLKIYAKNSTVSVFSDAVGWKEFQDKLNDLEGIRIIDRFTIQFNFLNPPSGLLEYLSMPYFGFYDEENFDLDKWKDDKKIVSSSKYRVKKYDKKEIVLELRNDFKLNTGNEPKIIKISIGAKKILNKEEAYIFENRSKNTVVDGTELVHSTPTILNAIIVSPFLAPFLESDAREYFLNRLEEEMGMNEVPFYFKNANTILKYENIDHDRNFLKGKEIRIFMQNLNDVEENDRYLKLWKSLSIKFGFTYKIDTPETLGKNWIKIALTNEVYHLRVARVDIGGAPENWGIGMMFCTSLGIRFPDPGNEICKVYEKYKIKGIDNQEIYEKEIFKKIEQSKTVAPVRHTGFSWYFSNNIDLKNYSQTMPMPKLDLITIK